jgi:WD40 repeat protein
LVQNPMTLEMIASASEMGGDIQLWNFKPESWQLEEAPEGGSKRQKTGVKTVAPTGSIKNVSGVTSIHWSTVDSIVCGGNDHQIKVMDVNKQAVQESIFTQHKTMTAVDTSAMMVLAGMEDGIVKVFDLRSQSTKAQSVMEFSAHQKWVSQVKCNP